MQCITCLYTSGGIYIYIYNKGTEPTGTLRCNSATQCMQTCSIPMTSSFEGMAASDNVVRAGCTPKFKDVDVLCDNLTYVMGSADSKKFRGTADAASSDIEVYRTPVPEFDVSKITLKASQAGLAMGKVRHYPTGISFALRTQMGVATLHNTVCNTSISGFLEVGSKLPYVC